MDNSILAKDLSRRALFRAGGVLGAAAAVGTLAGCGRKSSPAGSTAAGGKTTNLNLALRGSATDRPVWLDMISQFEKANPHITVKPQFFADPPGTSDGWTSFFTTLQTRILGGEKYDVVAMATEGQLLFADKGLLEPFDAYMQKDKAAVDNYRADVDPTVLHQIEAHGSSDGKTYVLPFGQNTEAIWYRPSIFKAASVAEPSPDWTLDDLREKAVQLANPSKKVYGIAFGTDLFGFGPYLQSEGGRYLSDDWKQSKVNSPQSAQAMSMTTDLIKKQAAPAPGGVFDPNVAMAQGKLAMMSAGRWPILAFRQQKFDLSDLKIVPFPKGEGGSVSTVGYGSMTVLKSSSNKDAAWEFVKYTISPSFADYHARTAFGGNAPVRKSAATGDSMQSNSPTGTPYLYQALSTSQLVPGIPKQAQLGTPFATELTQVLTGGVSPTAALSQIDEQWRQALSS